MYSKNGIKIGRPSRKNDELIVEICERIAEGRSIASVSKDEDMPDHNTLWRWMNSDEAFRDRYRRAIDARAMAHADRIVDITNSVLAGKIAPDAARVALDGMKWTAARLLPKVYGDRQTVDATVTHTHTLHLEALRELARRSDIKQDTEIKRDATLDVLVMRTNGDKKASQQPLVIEGESVKPRRGRPRSLKFSAPPRQAKKAGRAAAAPPLPDGKE